MPVKASYIEWIRKEILGQAVVSVGVRDGDIEILFRNGVILAVDSSSQALRTRRRTTSRAAMRAGEKSRPTVRQAEYLEFIAKYIQNFGCAPAESDIQRHFMISAPSVNHMMQTLERLGFITRQRGRPRSIRICEGALTE